jgi:hypothetical protein
MSVLCGSVWYLSLRSSIEDQRRLSVTLPSLQRCAGTVVRGARVLSGEIPYSLLRPAAGCLCPGQTRRVPSFTVPIHAGFHDKPAGIRAIPTFFLPTQCLVESNAYRNAGS